MADDGDGDRDVIMGEQPLPHENRAAIAVLQAQVRMISYVIRHDLVNRYEFAPVKLIAFGIAALVISSVLVGLLSYVVKAH